MRRNLPPEELGDFLDRPINAILAIHRRDGSLVQRPVWHRWADDHIEFQIPAGDRKITMLERDPRIQLIVSENEYPYRTLEVRGRAILSSDHYHDRAREIVDRYVSAYDPGHPIEAYLSVEPGTIVEIVAERIAGWDYADDKLHGSSSRP